jgi:hypothetical protein
MCNRNWEPFDDHMHDDRDHFDGHMHDDRDFIISATPEEKISSGRDIISSTPEEKISSGEDEYGHFIINENNQKIYNYEEYRQRYCERQDLEGLSKALYSVSKSKRVKLASTDIFV